MVARRCSVWLLESLSNAVQRLQAVKLVTLLKRDARTGVLEPLVRRCSKKYVFLIK